MSRFTGPLAVVFQDSRFAVLNEPLIWECDELGSGMTVTVPTAFVSDGASVPRMLWWFLPPWGDKATRAAILHDYLLELLDLDVPHPNVRTRRAVDRQFYLALRALGVARWRAWLTWFAVRIHSIWSQITTGKAKSGGV